MSDKQFSCTFSGVRERNSLASLFAGSIQALVLAVFALANTAIAQTSDTLSGTVTNASGEPVVEARVLVRGSRVAALTDEQGRYRLSQAATGSQTVVISAPGYNPFTREIELVAGQDNTFDAQLEPSATDMSRIVVTGVAAETDIQNAAGDIDIAGSILDIRLGGNPGDNDSGHVRGRRLQLRVEGVVLSGDEFDFTRKGVVARGGNHDGLGPGRGLRKAIAALFIS